MTLISAAAHTGLLDHLCAVEDLLERRLTDLAVQWREGSRCTDTVLGADDIPELLAGLVFSGGKRLRPQICWWGWAASGAPERGLDPEMVVRISAALELLHAFGLAQDDVMDESALRRGRPTVHRLAAERHRAVAATGDADRYGDSIAVLAGDLAHAEAAALIAGTDEKIRTLWWRMSVELVRGQSRDLGTAAHEGERVGPDGGPTDAAVRALEVAHAKSGAYTVQRPLELGAVAGEADPRVRAALSRFGRLLGEAFALRDDLLGVWGDPELTGKPASDDLAAGKATYLLALAERQCTGPVLAAVRRVRQRRHDPDDVATVRTAMVEHGVRDQVEERITGTVTQARDVLAEAGLPAAAVAGLEELTGRIAWRLA